MNEVQKEVKEATAISEEAQTLGQRLGRWIDEPFASVIVARYAGHCFDLRALRHPCPRRGQLTTDFSEQSLRNKQLGSFSRLPDSTAERIIRAGPCLSEAKITNFWQLSVP